MEAKRRIEDLLVKLRHLQATGPGTLSGEPLRQARAVEVLERIGTPEAKRLLAQWSKGAPHATLTREANDSLNRLARRVVRTP